MCFIANRLQKKWRSRPQSLDKHHTTPCLHDEAFDSATNTQKVSAGCTKCTFRRRVLACYLSLSSKSNDSMVSSFKKRSPSNKKRKCARSRVLRAQYAVTIFSRVVFFRKLKSMLSSPVQTTVMPTISAICVFSWRFSCGISCSCPYIANRKKKCVGVEKRGVSRRYLPFYSISGIL